jgi:aryl-alcohol dehydrogenase-like predicted oxidoreductase
MRYTGAGSSGLKVSGIGLGMMRYGDRARLGHLEDAIASLQLSLSEDEMARLEAPYRPHPILGHS